MKSTVLGHAVPHRVRRSLIAVIVWGIVDVLRGVNRGYIDKDVRAMAGELTRAEMAAEKREDEINHQKNIDAAVFLNDF